MLIFEVWKLSGVTLLHELLGNVDVAFCVSDVHIVNIGEGRGPSGGRRSRDKFQENLVIQKEILQIRPRLGFFLWQRRSQRFAILRECTGKVT